MLTMQHNTPLHDKNWFKTGGPARFFCQPTTPHEFQEALQYAQQNELPIFILGHGANILISDDGFDGLVIQPQLQEIITYPYDAHEVLIQAQAGVSLNDLIEYCLAHTISGLEEFSGIPGSMGGSVYINVHYFEFLLSDFLCSAEVVEQKTGIIHTVQKDWFNFGYNQSRLLDASHYLISATFKLKKITELETAYAYGRRDEIIRHRAKRYPTSNTCGSFFRNFYPRELSSNISLPYIAYYLDKIGIKGHLSSGGAAVSHQHANMFINKGSATSDDIITLARTAQELVRSNFGITPQPECQLIGFKEYPLLV